MKTTKNTRSAYYNNITTIYCEGYKTDIIILLLSPYILVVYRFFVDNCHRRPPFYSVVSLILVGRLGLHFL